MQTSFSWLLFAAGCTAHPVGDAEDADPNPSPHDTACVEASCDDTGDEPGDPAGDDTAGGDTSGEDTAGDDTGTNPATLPSEVLDLTNWKLTLPFGQDGDPVEIEQPELATYTHDPHFRLGENRDVVVFNANAGGVTTAGSHFPRSELREMVDDGTAKAAWSTTSGVHTMTITEAITHLPEVVPHIVAGQIHDANEYVLLVRLDDNRLWVKSGGSEVGVLDEDYRLGDEFTVRLAAADGRIDVYYNDLETPAVSLPYETTGCYFKAGAYLQSNTEYGDDPDAYGEVEIRDLVVTHQ